MKYKDINQTNNTEVQYLPEIIKCISDNFPKSKVIILGDNLLNFLGVDIIIDNNNNKKQMFCDVKICQYCHDLDVIIDAYKHDSNGNWFPASDVKLNDWFIFLNAENIIFVKADQIKIPPIEECWFYKRDLYKTTKKANISLSKIRKKTFCRKNTSYYIKEEKFE